MPVRPKTPLTQRVQLFVAFVGLFKLGFAVRNFLLELHDSGRLFVDGEEKEVRIAPPYRWEFDLEAGEHTLELEICNNSGNRDRMLGLPAGIRF